jgi:hypothetical protein
MPSHPHEVTPYEDPAAAMVRLARLLGQLRRRLGLRGPAGEAAPARVISSVAELRRQLRYVDLNAPRDGWVACPAAWVWSTHRDVIGAVVDPWVTATRVAAALDDREPGFVSRYHAYVSANPSCRVDGTPLPLPAAPREFPDIPLERIAQAAAAATRASLDALCRPTPKRTLFVHLAREQGWTSRRLLARRCECSVSTLDRVAARNALHLLPAGRLCLGSRRLLTTPQPWPRGLYAPRI